MYAQDKGAQCAASIAAAHGHLGLELLHFLQKYRVDLNGRGEIGKMSLTMAVGVGRLDMMAFPLDAGCSLTRVDDLGHSPITRHSKQQSAQLSDSARESLTC